MLSGASWDASGKMKPLAGHTVTRHLFSKGLCFTEHVEVFMGGPGGDWDLLLSGRKQAWTSTGPEGLEKKAEQRSTVWRNSEKLHGVSSGSVM